jgi:hypothetical protein
MFELNFICLICVVFACSIDAQTIYGDKQYIQSELGNINILLSVPHDGYMSPSSIPNRTAYSPIDYNTRVFAQLVRNELSVLFSKHPTYVAKPFVVYNNLHRTKLDANRDTRECCTNSESLKAHSEYHSTMIQENFRRNFLTGTTKYQKGILNFDSIKPLLDFMTVFFLFKSVNL